MEPVKVCYSIRDNIGDAINPFIVKEVIGYDLVHADAYHCDISGIGSGLGRFFYKPDSYTYRGNLRRDILRHIYTNPVILWSSGFISTPTGQEKKLRRNIIPAAVRGQLSLNYVNKFLNKECCDCVLGDAGILASELLEKKPEKKYSLGIIPHDNERGHIRYTQLQSKINNSTIIDVRGEVKDILKKIAECECIISSSLHGLIIADGFHIPNRQVILTDKLAGDGFKFADYYSSYGLQPDAINLNVQENVELSDICDNYSIKQSVVEQKKKELHDAFKKYL